MGKASLFFVLLETRAAEFPTENYQARRGDVAGGSASTETVLSLGFS